MKLTIQDSSGYIRTWPAYLEGGASDDFVEEWAVLDENDKSVYLSRTYQGALDYVIKHERAEKRRAMIDKRRELKANSRRIA